MPYEILPQGEYLLMICKGECNGDEKPPLQEALQAKMTETSLKYLVIQCSECSLMSNQFLRQLSQIYRSLKSVNGMLRLVNANKDIRDAIVRNGLDRILVPKMSLRGALVDFGLVKSKEFDVNFINPFLAATVKTLKVQCFIEAKAQAPFLKKATDPLLLGDISGIIAISAETFNGTLAISFPEKVFLKLASNMLSEVIPQIHDGVVDLVGEIANIVLGQAKLELVSLGYSFQSALPSCVWGKEHKIKHFGGGACVVIPFETPEGTFYAEIMSSQGLLTNKAPTRAA